MPRDKPTISSLSEIHFYEAKLAYKIILLNYRSTFSLWQEYRERGPSRWQDSQEQNIKTAWIIYAHLYVLNTGLSRSFFYTHQAKKKY